MILALGITHFTWIKGQHIVVNLLLIKPFWRTKISFILELPTRVMTFLFDFENLGPEKIVKKRGLRISKSNKFFSKAYLKILAQQYLLNGP